MGARRDGEMRSLKKWRMLTIPADVLGTLLIHLRTRSESMRKPAGYTFLLNNGQSPIPPSLLTSRRPTCLDRADGAVSHIRNTTSSFHSDIIGPAAEDMLNQAFRDAKSCVSFLPRTPSPLPFLHPDRPLTIPANSSPLLPPSPPSSPLRALPQAAPRPPSPVSPYPTAPAVRCPRPRRRSGTAWRSSSGR